VAERFNVSSHLMGSILTAFATIALIDLAADRGRLLAAVGFGVYGIGIFASYLSSAAYHAARGRKRVLLRRYDRAAIHLAIAAGQTPVALLALPFPLAPAVLGIVWGLALLGVSRELRPRPRSERRSVIFYLLNGWGILLFHGYLTDSISTAGIAWLLSSGVLYSVGAAIMSCRFVPRNHEIWHVLVLAGNACHFLAVFGLLS
jgi:hemolysin III